LAAARAFTPFSLSASCFNRPSAIVAGFFDPYSAAAQHWNPGRNRLLARIVARRTIVSLPPTILACRPGSPPTRRK